MRIRNLFKPRYKRFDPDVEPPSIGRKYAMLYNALKASNWGRAGEVQSWLEKHQLAIPETIEEAERFANGYRFQR